MPPIVVCDAGPIIHLDEVACIELLSDFPEVLVPVAVWDEVAKHRAQALGYSSIRFNKVTPTETPSIELDALSRLGFTSRKKGSLAGSSKATGLHGPDRRYSSPSSGAKPWIGNPWNNWSASAGYPPQTEDQR